MTKLQKRNAMVEERLARANQVIDVQAPSHPRGAFGSRYCSRREPGRQTDVSAGIEGIRPRRFPKTTDSSHTLPIAANTLDRQFGITKVREPNRT